MIRDRHAAPTRLLLWITFAGATCLPAQTTVTVPGGFDSTEAPNVAFWAISPFTARRQLLLDEVHLAGLRGMSIKSISLRRNNGDPAPLQAGAIRLDITMSHARMSADQASSNFDLNRGASTEAVFGGVVGLPASPAQRNSPAPWEVEIHFQKPFAYQGGTLCIETVSTPVSQQRQPWWPLDALIQRGGGQVSRFGTGCIADMGPQPAGATGAGLTPGATTTLYLRGRTKATLAFLGLGTNDRSWGSIPLPLDLSFVGAAGCHIYTDIRIFVPAGFQSFPNSDIALASFSGQIPMNAALVGSTIFSQWFVTTSRNPFGIEFSNGVRTMIGARPGLTGVAWIEQTDLARQDGNVLLGRVPVLRFTAR